MNISNKFIDMSKQAKEIQKIWEPKDGDVIYIPEGIDFGMSFPAGIVYEKTKKSNIRVIKLDNDYSSKSRSVYQYIIKDEIAFGSVFCEDMNPIYYKLKDIVWLPRLDQLFDMIEFEVKKWDVLFCGLQGCISLVGKGKIWEDPIHGLQNLSKFEEYNEVMLALVMEKNYNKIWKDKWIIKSV